MLSSIIPYKTEKTEKYDEETGKFFRIILRGKIHRHSDHSFPSAKISFVRRIQKFTKTIDKILKIV